MHAYVRCPMSAANSGQQCVYLTCMQTHVSSGIFWEQSPVYVCVCVCVCVCARFQSQVIVPCQCMFQPTGNGGRRFQHNCCTHCSGASVVACTYVSVCVDVSVDWHRQMSVQVVVRFIIVAVAVCRATPHTTYIDRTKWRLGVSEE